MMVSFTRHRGVCSFFSHGPRGFCVFFSLFRGYAIRTNFIGQLISDQHINRSHFYINHQKMNSPPPSEADSQSGSSSASTDYSPLGGMELTQLLIYRTYLKSVKQRLVQLNRFQHQLWYHMEIYNLNAQLYEVGCEILQRREGRGSSGLVRSPSPPSPSPRTYQHFPVYNGSEGSWSPEDKQDTTTGR